MQVQGVSFGAGTKYKDFDNMIDSMCKRLGSAKNCRENLWIINMFAKLSVCI